MDHLPLLSSARAKWSIETIPGFPANSESVSAEKKRTNEKALQYTGNLCP